MEGEVNERLWTLKNNLRVLKGRGVGGWGSQVVGIKEGTYCVEHWVWCKKMNTVMLKRKKKMFIKAFFVIAEIRNNLHAC